MGDLVTMVKMQKISHQSNRKNFSTRQEMFMWKLYGLLQDCFSPYDMGHIYTSSLRGISYESLDYKNVKSGEKVERKLCNFVDTCSSEGFCITAKSARDPFPCNHHLGDFIGSPIVIFRTIFQISLFPLWSY